MKRLLLWRRPSGGGGGGPRSGSVLPDAPEESAVAAAAEEETEGEPPDGGGRAACMAELRARRRRHRGSEPEEGTGGGRGGAAGSGSRPTGATAGGQEVRRSPVAPAAAPPAPPAERVDRGWRRSPSRGPAPGAAASGSRVSASPPPRARKRFGGRSGASPCLRLPLFTAGRRGWSQQSCRRRHRPLQGPGATAGLVAEASTEALTQLGKRLPRFSLSPATPLAQRAATGAGAGLLAMAASPGKEQLFQPSFAWKMCWPQ